MELLDEEGARARVNEYMASHQWWIIPWITDHTRWFSATIEERYYAGEANGDFHVMTLVGPPEMRMIPVSFARKKRLPVRAMARFMKETDQGKSRTLKEWQEVLKTQDVIVAGQKGVDPNAVKVVLSWLDAWRVGRVSA